MFPARLIFAAALAVICVPALPAAPAKSDLTIQARAVLRKYCADCHHPDAGHFGEISVLDRTGLERAGRPFLLPGKPTASQLLQLIDDGSMPPGNRDKPTDAERQIIRDWISQDAAPYPRQFDDDYVLRAILANVQNHKEVAEADRPFVRYVSLHNVVPDKAPAFVLEPKREALRKTAAELSKSGQLALQPIDPAEIVFRLDLRQSGWDLKPFKRRVLVDGKASFPPSNVSLFDLILVEYPFGRMDLESATFKQLVEAFLKPADQAVPISYLRGDWLVDDFAHSQVAAEICKAFNKPPPADRPPAFGPLVEPNDVRGTPILPLDALNPGGRNVDPKTFTIFFEAWDADKGLSKSTFVPGDRLAFHVRPSKQVNIEIVWHNADGTCAIPNLGNNEVIDGTMEKVFGMYRIKEVYGKEDLTIFASEAEFPRGDLLKSKEPLNAVLRDRVIHPFYTLPGVKTKYAFDPAKIMKKTVEIEIRQK